MTSTETVTLELTVRLHAAAEVLVRAHLNLARAIQRCQMFPQPLAAALVDSAREQAGAAMADILYVSHLCRKNEPLAQHTLRRLEGAK